MSSQQYIMINNIVKWVFSVVCYSLLKVSLVNTNLQPAFDHALSINHHYEA